MLSRGKHEPQDILSRPVTEGDEEDVDIRTALGLTDPDAPVLLPIALIKRDSALQPRVAIDPAIVQDYAEDMIKGDKFPPGLVFFDGQTYLMVRGYTRTAAAELAGKTEFEYIVRPGDRRAAILFSVGENADHGARRTNDDRRRAVMTLLSDDEWAKWSNREIADQCKVSHTYVNTLRTSLETVSSEPQERVYKTKHGTVSTMRTANIGRREPVIDHPAPPVRVPPAPVAPARPSTLGGEMATAILLLLDAGSLDRRLLVDQVCNQFRDSEPQLVEAAIAQLRRQGMLADDGRRLALTREVSPVRPAPKPAPKAARREFVIFNFAYDFHALLTDLGLGGVRVEVAQLSVEDRARAAEMVHELDEMLKAIEEELK